MDIKDIIKMALVKNHMSSVELAEKLGTSKQNLSNKFCRNDFKFSDIEKIFGILGLKITITDNDGMEYK